MPIDTLAQFATATIPVFLGRIPATPAALLGRLAVPEEPEPTRPTRLLGRRAVPEQPAPTRPTPLRRVDRGEPACVGALQDLGQLLVERLFGALELTVAGHDWSAAPDVSEGVAPMPQHLRFAMVSAGQQSEVTMAVTMLERLRSGSADRVAALVRELAAHPAITPLLAVPGEAHNTGEAQNKGEAQDTGEAQIAAGHGAAHLALAVSVAGAFVHHASPPAVDRVAATVGLAVGAAVLLLRAVPLPTGYAAARLAKLRAEYLLPAHLAGAVTVAGHRFGLTERELPDAADFGANGLVAVVDGGVVVRTGVEQGHLQAELLVLADPPPAVETRGWEEIVEVSWHAAAGSATLTGLRAGRGRGGQTPPWPGDYRVRVHARGRDDLDAGFEHYKLVVWAAPAGPPVVHLRTDQLGHRLRGEPEPVRAERPEQAYRWIRRGPLEIAATVTVVTGRTVEQVLRAFGADPGRPEPSDAIQRELSLRQGIDPWVTVHDAGDAVLVVEPNGWRGSEAPVLVAASANGRAASMFWNVNALTRLSFAEQGRLLASFEPPGHEPLPPELAGVLTGLDFGDYHDKKEKGLVAVERFTGRGLTAADLASIVAANTGYRVTSS